MFTVISGEFFECAVVKLLVDFGEFTGDDRLPVVKDSVHVSQGDSQAMGRFVKNHHSGLVFQLGQFCLPLALFGGEKTFKHKTITWQA